MKSKITETPQPDKGITFPCLMQSTKLQCIVLFADAESGVVVHNDNGPHPLGRVSKEWANCIINDYDIWQPFTGTVHLSNE